MENISIKLPSLKDAKKRTRKPINIYRDLYELSESLKKLGENKKYYLRTYGCQANERDSETIVGILDEMSFTKTDDYNEADLLIFNTCAIRENAANKVFGEIGQLKRLKVKNPEVIFAVCGCMVQEEITIERIMNTYKQVDIVFGTHNIHRLPQLLENFINTKERTIEVFSIEGDVIENLPVKRFNKYKAWVNIMYGCDKFCTYCIVPYTRGKQRSRLMKDILDEVKELKEQGYKEITLLGQNVNSYGLDLGMEDGFATLLEEVAKINIERIRFATSHPRDFSLRMIDVIKDNKNIMPYLHLPVQSGNNEILRLMGRGYTVERFKMIYDKLKEAIPNIAFSTDMIVGFPNETREQFEDTLKLVDYCKFDFAFIFIYSPRAGTPAAKFIDNIDSKEKSERLQELNERVAKYGNLNNQKYLNKVVKVLVDGKSKRNDEVYSGYSEENKLVNFTGKNIKEGDIVEVLITEIKSWSMNGEKIN